MGIKLLSLHMIPWCFHVMGNNACHPSDQPASPSGHAEAKASRKAHRCIKLIKMDGKVEVYHRPVSASELMSEHPKHLVCRSDAFTIGQRIPALSEGDRLKPGHAYFLLPVHFFQSVLSFVTLASSFARAAAAVSAASSAKGGASSSALFQRPFDVQKTPSGKLQIRISDEFIQRMQEAQEWKDGGAEEGGGGGGGRVCTTAALEKDYRQLVVGSRERQWKPKLETIRESERRKGTLAAAVALRSIRRRRKKGHQVDPHTEDPKQKPQKKQKKKKQKQPQQQEPQQQKKKLKQKSQDIDSPSHDEKQELRQMPQKQPKRQKKQKQKGQQIDSPSLHDEKQELQQKPQQQQQPQKKQKQKASTTAKKLPSHKSKGKNVMACHL